MIRKTAVKYQAELNSPHEKFNSLEFRPYIFYIAIHLPIHPIHHRPNTNREITETATNNANPLVSSCVNLTQYM